jgi:hypothetical protein
MTSATSNRPCSFPPSHTAVVHLGPSPYTTSSHSSSHSAQRIVPQLATCSTVAQCPGAAARSGAGGELDSAATAAGAGALLGVVTEVGDGEAAAASTMGGTGTGSGDVAEGVAVAAVATATGAVLEGTSAGVAG